MARIPATATIRTEYRKCGRKNCARCPHGPYRYAYWRGSDGKLKSAYVKSTRTRQFGDMGEVYTLRGMKISVFTKGEERHPAHFHIYYRAGHGLGANAQVDIESGKVIEGELAANVRKLLRKWLDQPGVREALRENWRRARAGQSTFRIEIHGVR